MLGNAPQDGVAVRVCLGLANAVDLEQLQAARRPLVRDRGEHLVRCDLVRRLTLGEPCAQRHERLIEGAVLRLDAKLGGRRAARSLRRCHLAAVLARRRERVGPSGRLRCLCQRRRVRHDRRQRGLLRCRLWQRLQRSACAQGRAGRSVKRPCGQVGYRLFHCLHCLRSTGSHPAVTVAAREPVEDLRCTRKRPPRLALPVAALGDLFDRLAACSAQGCARW